MTQDRYQLLNILGTRPRFAACPEVHRETIVANNFNCIRLADQEAHQTDFCKMEQSTKCNVRRISWVALP